MTLTGKPLTDVRSPILREIHAYWESKRGDRRMPARADLDPLDFPALLPNVILMDVMPADGRLKVRLVGTLVVQMFGGDYTGMYLDEIDFGEMRQKILDDYGAAAKEAKAIFTDHRFRKLGGHTFDIERVVLPLSDDGEHATMLMALLDFTQREERSEMPL
ncbi:MAG: PAS domain-containing protein [Thalassobaculaceae bacterium]